MIETIVTHLRGRAVYSQSTLFTEKVNLTENPVGNIFSFTMLSACLSFNRKQARNVLK
jgi:hypothetical protein